MANNSGQAQSQAGYEDLDISSVSKGFQTIPDHSTSFVRVHIQDADVRFRLDGEAAVAGNGGGQLLLNGSYHNIKGAEKIRKAAFIRNASTDVVIDCIYS